LEQLLRSKKISKIDTEISKLVEFGLLIHEGSNFLFSIPNIGIYKFRQGRNKLLSILRNKAYSEILLSDLQKMKFGTRFDTLFHIKDALGLRLIESVQTSAGTLIRLLDK